MCGQIYIPEVNWTLMLLCLAITVGFKDLSSHKDTYALKAVADLPAPFRSTFSFRYFNSLQSECFPTCYFSDVNMVISAPTGRGKTVLFELCIMRLFSKFIDRVGKFSHHKGTLKTIYIAPSKALVQEKVRDWIHLLNDPRGAALEAIVSRIKMVTRNPDTKSSSLSRVFFLAVSATIPNINDLAEWRMVPAQGIKRFEEEMRPVQLTTKVFGYTPAKNDFLFEKAGCGYQQQLVPGMRPGGGPIPNLFVPLIKQGQRPGGRHGAGGVQQTQQPMQQQAGFGYQQQPVPWMRPGGGPTPNVFVPLIQHGQRPGIDILAAVIGSFGIVRFWECGLIHPELFSEVPEVRFLVGLIVPRTLMGCIEFERDLVCSTTEFIQSVDHDDGIVIRTPSTNENGIRMWGSDNGRNSPGARKRVQHKDQAMGLFVILQDIKYTHTLMMDDVVFERNVVCNIAEEPAPDGSNLNTNIGTTSTNENGIRMWAPDDKDNGRNSSGVQLPAFNWKNKAPMLESEMQENTELQDNCFPLNVKLHESYFLAGYTPAKNDFLFEKGLQNYIFDLLMQFSGGKSALIFCSTRKGAQEAAQRLSQIAMTYGNSSLFIKIREQQERLREASLSCSDKQMQSYILYGVGYHNGGLSSADIPHLMSINCILGLVPIPNLYPLVDQLKHEHAAKVTGHSESWFYTDGVIVESDSKDDFYSVGEEVSHGSLSNLGCPRFSNQPLLENGTDYQPASDEPQNEAKNPPLLRGENSRGNEPGGVHKFGFISNRLLPCLACDEFVEAKVLGGSSMRRRMALTPSFKWREAQENSVLSMAKPIVPRPISGSEDMSSPFEKKQPECWSRVDPNTL